MLRSRLYPARGSVITYAELERRVRFFAMEAFRSIVATRRNNIDALHPALKDQAKLNSRYGPNIRFLICEICVICGLTFKPAQSPVAIRPARPPLRRRRLLSCAGDPG